MIYCSRTSPSATTSTESRRPRGLPCEIVDLARLHRTRASSIQDFLDVPHSVQNPKDLNGAGLWIIDDHVRVDGPEFHWTASEVLANMTGAWFFSQKLQSGAHILWNPA